LQGGLLLTQIQRETKPLEVALDAMLDRIQSLTESASAGAGLRRHASH
jgi:TetR/AcrR family transcriptional regulator, transcriptional repressor for nem operon